MALELNDGTKVNIEMQVKRQKNWIRRKLFYLAKLYTEDLRVGQHYDRLCKCISISILDFDLIEGEKYHSEYRLRDRDGKELTDLLELHIIELRKPLQGTDAVNDWVRLFNAEKTEDLDMIREKNKGITEAIEVVKEMSLGRTLRQIYEYRIKMIRDRWAEDEYVRELGREEGKAEGKAEAKAEDILALLGEVGDVPPDLCEKITAEKDLKVFDVWIKAAARAESISQFRERCGL